MSSYLQGSDNSEGRASGGEGAGDGGRKTDRKARTM